VDPHTPNPENKVQTLDLHRTPNQPNTMATVTSKCLWCVCGANSCGAIRQRQVIGAPEDHVQVTSQFTATAWKCHDNYLLDPALLAPNEPLQLCVRSDSPVATILGVKGLTCQQETTPGSYYTAVSINDGEVIDPDLTQVAYPRLSMFGQIAVIKMDAASAFFEGPDPNDMFAFGSVTLQLVGTRRCLHAEFQVAQSLGPAG
jgi:hypothetical protein